MSKSKEILKSIVDFLVDLLIAFVVVWLVTNFLIVNGNVPTSSMCDTIPVNARFFASRLHTAFGDIERTDILVFKAPDDGTIYIKRVIGLPGETIEGKSGEVYIDGKELDEPYIKDKIAGDFGPYTIPEDHYFMMGDNRLNSKDSRYWENKFLSKDDILGKAILMYYPNIKRLDKIE